MALGQAALLHRALSPSPRARPLAGRASAISPAALLRLRCSDALFWLFWMLTPAPFFALRRATLACSQLLAMSRVRTRYPGLPSFRRTIVLLFLVLSGVALLAGASDQGSLAISAYAGVSTDPDVRRHVRELVEASGRTWTPAGIAALASAYAAVKRGERVVVVVSCLLTHPSSPTLSLLFPHIWIG